MTSILIRLRALAAPALILAGALSSSATLAAEAKTKQCKLEQLAELPVTMVGARPTVPVKINGHEAPFFIDSGAQFGTLSPDWAERLGVHPHIEPGYKIKGAGGEQDMYTGNVDEFLIGGIPFRHVDFFVAKGGLEPSVAGVVGQNLLGAVDTEYDLANGVVRLFKPENCGDGGLAYWAKDGASMLPIEPTPHDHRDIITPVYVNGQRIRAKWDTGAPRSDMIARAAARAGITPKSEGAIAAGTVSGFGSSVSNSWIAPFDSFKVGDEEIRHTRLRFTDASFGDQDMLLGLDFFLSHRVFVANSQNRIYFTYNGGPVFRLDIAQVAAENIRERQAQNRAAAFPSAAPDAPAVADVASTPTTADAYRRRASAFVARLNFPAAIEDMTKAIALEPDNPANYLSRAQALIASNQQVRAVADLDEVLKRQPDNTDALLGRGLIYAVSHDGARARADLNAAARLSPDKPEIGLRIANTYTATGFYDDAIAAFDAWLDANPKAANRAQGLNGRCWSRAVLKKDLDKALADCDAAIKLAPKAAGILDSRGLAHLDRGEFDLAIADYDAAIKLAPKQAMSFYARGVAKERQGHKDEGGADIQAAVVLNPRVADQAKRAGIAP